MKIPETHFKVEAGLPPARGKGGKRSQCKVVAAAFEGVRKLERQRMVQDAAAGWKPAAAVG